MGEPTNARFAGVPMRERVLDNRVRTAYCLVEERPQLVGLSSRADWNSQS